MKTDSKQVHQVTVCSNLQLFTLQVTEELIPEVELVVFYRVQLTGHLYYERVPTHLQAFLLNLHLHTSN